MKRRAALKVFARALEWLSIVVGLGLVASCTTAGFASNHMLGGLAGFAVAGVIAAAFVGVVFLLTTASRRALIAGPSRAGDTPVPTRSRR